MYYPLIMRNTRIVLSKYIWKLKNENKTYTLKWRIMKKSQAYRNGAKKCNLCLTEKLLIISGNPSKLFNKRSELISKCRHENKFYVKNYKTSIKDDHQMNSAGTNNSRRVSLENNDNSAQVLYKLISYMFPKKIFC